MSLLFAIDTLLIFPVFFIERFITPSASVAPASSASVYSNALHKHRSFGLSRLSYNHLAVFIEEVQSLLEFFLVPVVPSVEIIL